MKSERQENLLKISQKINWHIMSFSSVNRMFSVESIAQVSSLSMLLASNAVDMPVLLKMEMPRCCSSWWPSS